MNNQVLSEFEPIAAIATTPKAAATLSTLNISVWVPGSDSEDLKTHLAKVWQSHRALVFGLATGAVVRLIAPLLTDKTQDPAVIVVDPEGQFVISLCSAHQGKADQLTRIIAQLLNATPILTGAAANSNLCGIDILGVPYGWQKGTGNWTGVSAAIARGEKIEVIQEVGSTLWQDQLPEDHPFDFTQESGKATGRLWISATQRLFAPQSDLAKVQWHPRVLWVGVGCEKGTSKELIAEAITALCRRQHLAQGAIAGLATIDIKATEPGLVSLSQEWSLPLVTFTAAQLSQVNVPNPSQVVQQAVGTPSVAEASALLAAETDVLLVTKQIAPKITSAIAVAQTEYIGRQGKLWLVGIGPGAITQITGAAKGAITAADAVIGYSLYIDLIASLLRPGQIVESLAITQEVARAKRAIALAQWGLTVAVISSGDCGIYGMAGLVLEELGEETLEVEIFPGVSALQAAASRVGTPLMHDFCAISLSDLLTPWEVIEQRLIAAAQADFVTAIYNPRSRERIQPLIAAQSIFLQYRQSSTPVAIVRSAYRPDESIEMTTLEMMLDYPIDMLTTIIIGNASSYFQNQRLITPRGYRL
ncbi:precorrin-3B C(17)-methyltransferase [Gloeocapsa sp. PCC 73106]|uniref:precorrin-3B C(17)-methyltransferase n=1 Tax=Gloeocapsa sp. PCC 73106 TaxID=102232 RepID=UPI0002ACA38F|nr:precorrin-3B C(17)-methyltransferase [Gloeocapsa sp. PCC 73106]ELR99033.1 precorrin-3B C17-methyltransferase [Gloeocapsa sp. PCC 73106]